MDALEVVTRNQAPFYSVLGGVRDINSLKRLSNDCLYIACDNFKVLEYKITEAGGLELINMIDHSSALDTPISNISVYKDVTNKEDKNLLFISTESGKHWINDTDHNEIVISSDYEGYVSQCIEISNELYMIKFHQRSCKIILEKIYRPENKTKEVYRIANEYGYQYALEVAAKLDGNSEGLYWNIVTLNILVIL